MRKTYLVCYDISDQKVYRKVYAKVKAYAVGGQKSCFECWMTESEKASLTEEIKELYKDAEERTDMFELLPHSKKLYFGLAAKKNFNPFFVF